MKAIRRTCIDLLVFWSFLSTLSVITWSRDILFVTDTGDDGNDCRSLQSSCRLLSHALSVAGRGYSVYLHQQNQDNAWLCHENPILITKSVNLIGYDSLTPVGCQATGHRLLMISINGTGNDAVNVSISNISATNILFLVSDSTFEMTDSILSGLKWQSGGLISFHLRNSVMEDRTGSKGLEITARKISFKLDNVTIARTKVNITAGSGTVSVRNSTVTNIAGLKYHHGGMIISFTNRSEMSRISVEDSIFEKQINENPVDGIMNLHDAALKVALYKPYNPNVWLTVSGCTFRDNERGLSIMGLLSSAVISDSKFEDNIAMHAGAGILLLSDKQNPTVHIQRCSFDRNAAGSFRYQNVRNYNDSFHVGSNEVTINSDCCKGIISPVGKGGAIRVQKGDVTISESSFRENTASQLGGAIFVDREGNLTLNDVYFQNSEGGDRPLEGDIIYSNGVVKMGNTRLNVTGASSQVSILCHSGDMWSIEVIDVGVTCPKGYRLRIANSSVYKIDTSGLLKSYKLDQLSYFCESCPRNKYSLDFGYLNYSLRFHSISYFTLLVNGSFPVPAYSGSYVYHDIECHLCPYGGKCLQGISAVSNFWGYPTGDNQVRFQRCNKGYCCSSSDCNGYNRCRNNRVGVLCGECEAGYSEAMFTAECVLNSTCDPTIGWPVMVTSAILYFIFLLFQKDMRDLMFSRIKVAMPKPDSDPHHDVRQHVAGPRVHNETKIKSQAQQLEMEPLHNEDTLSGTEFKDHYMGNNLVVETTEESRDGSRLELNPSSSSVKQKQQSKQTNTPTAADRGVSFLIIIFFYFQDAQLFHIKTVFASVDHHFVAMFREFLSGLFKFRVEVFQFMHKFCFLEDMTPIKKMIVRVGLVPCVLAQFGVVYLINRWCVQVRRRTSANDIAPELKSTRDHKPVNNAPSFSTKLATGFVLALLFTYQKLATTSFTLLNCVSVGSETVLFIQGTVSCYQSWQYGVIAYAATCIIPFSFVLLIGPGLLKDDMIGLGEFFIACIVPLPFLLRWIWIRYRLYGKHSVDAKVLPPECQAVVQILQGPFKDAKSAFFGPICGQGFLIGRRLIIVLLYTFVNDTLIRMLCMMLLCFIILLHHVHVLPYKDERGNTAGSVSAASLVVLAVINLVRAGFEAAEYVPQGPNELLMRVLDEVENCLMLWFPGVVMGFIILTIISKLSLIIAQNILTICGKQKWQSRTHETPVRDIHGRQPIKTPVSSRRDDHCVITEIKTNV